MKEYKAITEEIYRLAKKVSKDLPFHATGIEKQLQEALAYEFRKTKTEIQAVREFFGEIYYNDFPVKDYRPDFVIFPDKKWKLEKTIIFETCTLEAVKELASGREECLGIYILHNKVQVSILEIIMLGSLNLVGINKNRRYKTNINYCF